MHMHMHMHMHICTCTYAHAHTHTLHGCAPPHDVVDLVEPRKPVKREKVRGIISTTATSDDEVADPQHHEHLQGVVAR